MKLTLPMVEKGVVRWPLPLQIENTSGSSLHRGRPKGVRRSPNPLAKPPDPLIQSIRERDQFTPEQVLRLVVLCVSRPWLAAGIYL